MASIENRSSVMTAKRQALLEALLQAEGVEGPRQEKIPRRRESDNLPLTFAQERLWLLSRLTPEDTSYNLAVALRLQGALDTAALEWSLNEIIRRHEALRTTFETVDGRPVQVIAPTLRLEIAMVNLTHLAEHERESEVVRFAREAAERPFDLSQSPLLRPVLLRLGENEHALIMSTHHIVSDNWSGGVLVGELGALYKAHSNNEASPLPELEIQCADYALWQRQQFTKETLEQQVTYWKQQLADAPAILEIPTDRPRPAIESHRGARHVFTIPRSVVDALKELARREDATLFMTLLAAFQTLLYRYTGQEDIVIGTPTAGRNRKEIEGLIGFFINTLVMRARFSADQTFNSLLKQVRETALGAYEHQDVPFEKLVEELQPERSLSHSPVFQVLFLLQNAPSGALSLPGLKLLPIKVERETAALDLVLELQEHHDGMDANVHYNTDLFDEDTIARLFKYYQTLLYGIVARPEARLSELPLLSEAERERVLVEWNQTESDYPAQKCIHQLFEEQAERTPDAVAVIYEDKQLGYRELNERANRLARYLQTLGVGTETLVSICMERSVEMIVGLLAILKAGGAYVPLDPHYPINRLSLMLEDAQTPVLLTKEESADSLPAGWANVVCLDTDWDTIAQHGCENLPTLTSAGNLAYIIYTSGSSGIPKGVCVSHRAVNRLLFNTDYVQLGTADRIAQASNASFDAATFEIWGALLHGGCLIGISKDVALSLRELAAHLAGQQVNTMFITTALFNQLAREEPAVFAGMKQVLFGGEAVDPRWVREVLRAGGPQRLLHVYGPTESTTFSTWEAVKEVTAEAVTIPIGRPIANTQAFVLDKEMQPVAAGMRGELYLGGDGLARGYLRDMRMTAERFVPDPFSPMGGERLYKTGDLVSYRPDGRIEFVGRVDQQVKLRGHRIELGEVEAVLNQHPAIVDSVAMVREDDPGDKRLVAYVVVDAEQAHADPELDLLRLPNDLEVVCFDKNEANYLYKEIFDDHIYIKHGITLNDGDCVFDVGANIGLFALYVRQYWPNASLYAFEPLPPTFNVLRTNVDLYGLDVKLFQCGLSNRSGLASFTFYPQMAAMSGVYADALEEEQTTRAYMSSKNEELSRHATEILEGRYETEKHECQLRTLSEVIREQGIENIDLLKVDVEKSELDVLQGIAEDDWARIKQVIIEVHNKDGRLAVICEMLERHGYKVTVEQGEALEKTGLYYVYGVHLTRAGEPAIAWNPGQSSTVLRRQKITISDVRKYLNERLPEYMIPAAFVQLTEMPLNTNGKVDRKALPAPDHSRPDLEHSFLAPRTHIEEMLAGVWSEVLKVEVVGVHDNFFELGGDSILSIQIVARAARAGLHLTPRDLFQHQSIAALATVVSSNSNNKVEAEQGRVSGEVALTPIQHWFFEQEMESRHHFNQAVMLEVPAGVEAAMVQRVVEKVIEHHDALRLRFSRQGGKWQQSNAAEESNEAFTTIDLSAVAESEQSAAITAAATHSQQSLNLEAGPLVKVTLMDLGAGRSKRLLIVIHHLAVDGVSWRILVEDFERGYEQAVSGEQLNLGAKTSSFRQWAARLVEYADSEKLRAQESYWVANERATVGRLPVDEGEGDNSIASERQVNVSLSEEETRALLTEVPGVYHTQINDVLLTAVSAALSGWSGERRVLIGLEGHGREEVIEGVDVTRTVGWFTTLYPAIIEVQRGVGMGEQLKSVKEQLREIPERGVGYGILKYVVEEEGVRERVRGMGEPEVAFNYLGQFEYFGRLEGVEREEGRWGVAGESSGKTESQAEQRRHLLAINGGVTGGRLVMTWSYSENVHHRATIKAVADEFIEELRKLIVHCQRPEAGGYTPSDFPMAELNQDDLNKLLGEVNFGD